MLTILAYKLHREVIQQPLPGQPTPLAIQLNPAWWPYFKDCIGALDGSHFPAHVPSQLAPVYRNRKGTTTQNVLAVCNFDYEFLYTRAGWEGSANDGRVLSDCVYKRLFNTPKGKYYLADAGYYCNDYLLVPYRGVRYHLREHSRGGYQEPANAKELFNLRHSQLRIVIEKVFGILKWKYKIHQTAPAFTLPKQGDIILATTAVHNFRLQYGAKWNDEGNVADGDLLPTNEQQASDDTSTQSADQATVVRRKMEKFRDETAAAIWRDYQGSYLRRQP